MVWRKRKKEVRGLEFVLCLAHKYTHARAAIHSPHAIHVWVFLSCETQSILFRGSNLPDFCWRELNTAVSGFIKDSRSALLIVQRWYDQIQHLFFPQDPLRLFPDSEWKVVGGVGVRVGVVRRTRLTRANKGAIKESAQPERQGLTFIEVDVYCSSCRTCQEGIKDFFVVQSELEKSKILKYHPKSWIKPCTIQWFMQTQIKDLSTFYLLAVCAQLSWLALSVQTVGPNSKSSSSCDSQQSTGCQREVVYFHHTH